MADASSSKPATESAWLQFEERLGISGSPPGMCSFFGENLYVITNRRSYKTASCGYYLFHIDLSSPSSDTPLEPILSWDQFLHDAFVVCGSTLYMFGGLGKNLRWKVTMSMFPLEEAFLSSRTRTTIFLKRKSLMDGPPMLGRKCCPVAVMIGDSRICVFGTLLYYDGVDTNDPQISAPCFEVFDTKERTWKSLPEPLTRFGKLRSLAIKSYCVHGSCLIIQPAKGGIQGINVDHPSPQWVKFEWHLPFQGIWTMINGYLFNSYHVMSRDKRRPYPFATKALLDMEIDLCALLCSPKPIVFPSGVDELCRVAVRFPHRWFTPSLVVDIIKFAPDESVEECGPDLSEWQGVESNEVFCFPLIKSCHGYEMEVIACSTTRMFHLMPTPQQG